MHIHILGICGTFMGGVAQLAKSLGHQVTGCDVNVYPPMSTQLEQAGIRLHQGFGVEQLDLKPDIWVIGNVVSRGNPLMEAILDAGLPYTSGPQWVGENILSGRQVLAVAGTHGKTTTSSMLAWCLDQLGLSPGFLIGGVPAGFECSARLGEGDLFVIEADEYDTAFFDKRSKFVHYRPKLAVLNNLEFDHADIFADLAAIETQFHHLVRTVPGSGHIICADHTESLQRVLKRGCWSKVSYFDAQDCTSQWSAKALSAHAFEVLHQGKACARIQWGLSGIHSLNNALAVIASACALGADVQKVCRALEGFPGVKRRMELKGKISGVSVYDDFAHHPTAIETTLAGARSSLNESGSEGRLIAIFEPRSNTMKQGVMRQALPDSFHDADLVWVYSGEVQWDVQDTFKTLGERAAVVADLESMTQAIVDTARPGDVLLVMSNGAFGGVHDSLIDGLTRKFA